jgi:glycolate dehydrogenase iron-sulfur subunit
MQTSFTLAQLADPQVAESEKILRACVHCGFCTATCPTYVLLGDELDSPRGRIYLIKDMLEHARPATAEVVKHIDRCLSCLACMTTCPSGVHYMHLVDHARAHIERTYARPLPDRAMRAVLAHVLPYPARFRVALALARLARPLVGRMFSVPPRSPAAPADRPRPPTRQGVAALMRRIAALLALTPERPPAAAGSTGAGVFPAQAARRGRVALLSGCAQQVLAPAINAAAIRLLTRHGVEVVLPKDEGCCGGLAHHMGREHAALAQAGRNIDAWMREIAGGGLDAILVTTSGCGVTLKDYGFMFRTDPAYADKAARVSALAKDVSEYIEELDPTFLAPQSGTLVAYHSACSLQHGQKIVRAPRHLLEQAGFSVKDVPEGHLCCGSAGTYNMLQPEIAAGLRDRKVANIEKLAPDLIAAGNIGCMVQIGQATEIPIVHMVELLDWATGGPAPDALKKNSKRAMSSESFEAVR